MWVYSGNILWWHLTTDDVNEKAVLGPKMTASSWWSEATAWLIPSEGIYYPMWTMQRSSESEMLTITFPPFQRSAIKDTLLQTTSMHRLKSFSNRPEMKGLLSSAVKMLLWLEVTVLWLWSEDATSVGAASSDRTCCATTLVHQKCRELVKVKYSLSLNPLFREMSSRTLSEWGCLVVKGDCQMFSMLCLSPISDILGGRVRGARARQDKMKEKSRKQQRAPQQ